MRATLKRFDIATCLLAAAIVTACQASNPEPDARTGPSEAVAGTVAPPAKPDHATSTQAAMPLRADAVWRNPDAEACRGQAWTGIADCLRRTMRSAGASPAAIAVIDRLQAKDEAGYMAKWTERDGIGIAQMEYPYRANTNFGTWLVGKDCEPVDVDADPLPASAKTDPSITRFMQAHADAFPVAPAELDGLVPIAGGGVRLVFKTVMAECRACAPLGLLQVGYDFDATRRYVGQHVLGIR